MRSAFHQGLNFLSVTALLLTMLIVMSRHSSADGLRSSLWDADTYWTDYWDWYNTEYQVANELRLRPYVGRYSPSFGASPALSTPIGGGDFDDHSIYFYFPDGASEWYRSKLGVPGRIDQSIDRVPIVPGRNSEAVPAAPLRSEFNRQRPVRERLRDDDIWY